MPEENWQIHGGVPACDLCYSRKVKCDRLDPCKNCVAANAQCLRTRQRRPTRPKPRTDDKIQALVERLSTLEGSISITRSQSTQEEEASVILNPFPQSQPALEQTLKRKRPVEEEPTMPTPSSESSQHQANEARLLIQRELSQNGRLSQDQRKVLEIAISFVDQISQTPISTVGRLCWPSKEVFTSTDLTRDEIVHVILATRPLKHASGDIEFRVIDHIPAQATERIALSLLDETADEETLLLCRVIVHFKAAIVFYDRHAQGPQSRAVEKHVRERAIHHLHAALTALDQLKMMTAPSLLLVQALVAGAMLMQTIGDPLSCWSLTASAARIAVALGYHNIRNLEPTSSDEEEEIHRAMAWLVHLDKAMSMMLVRPPSLPKMHITASSLWKPDVTNPMAITFMLALELTPVQEAWLELSVGSRIRIDQRSLKGEIEGLLNHMANVKIEKARPLYDPGTDLETTLHWQVLEFQYLVTLVAVHRLSPTVTCAVEREECLRCARNALRCVKDIHRLGLAVDDLTETYNPTLAWTILSYPLTPFFVVFCNVVGTPNVQDFQLLQDVMEVVASLPKENRYGARLYRLCLKLVELCQPLVERASVREEAGIPTPQTLPPSGHVDDTLLQPLPGNAGGIDAGDMEAVIDDAFASTWSPWRDDLMWQLFQSQPSLDWVNADIFNSMPDAL